MVSPEERERLSRQIRLVERYDEVSGVVDALGKSPAEITHNDRDMLAAGRAMLRHLQKDPPISPEDQQHNEAVKSYLDVMGRLGRRQLVEGDPDMLEALRMFFVGVQGKMLVRMSNEMPLEPHIYRLASVGARESSGGSRYLLRVTRS